MTQLDLVGHVDATELQPDVFVVAAHGPIDARVAAELRDLLIPIAAADGAVALLDLEEAHGLDAAAIDVVGVAAHLVARRGEHLRIVTSSALTRELLDDSGLGDVVDVTPSLREAIDG